MRGGVLIPEFKRECAERVLGYGYTVRQVCEVTSVGTTIVRRCVRHFQAERGTDMALSTNAVSSTAMPMDGASAAVSATIHRSPGMISLTCKGDCMFSEVDRTWLKSYIEKIVNKIIVALIKRESKVLTMAGL